MGKFNIGDKVRVIKIDKNQYTPRFKHLLGIEGFVTDCQLGSNKELMYSISSANYVYFSSNELTKVKSKKFNFEAAKETLRETLFAGRQILNSDVSLSKFADDIKKFEACMKKIQELHDKIVDFSK